MAGRHVLVGYGWVRVEEGFEGVECEEESAAAAN
jgi:hypothetical protein